jgi:hypothetical protein
MYMFGMIDRLDGLDRLTYRQPPNKQQSYVQSAVQTLRALVDLRLRRQQQQGSQTHPTARLTASEAAALLRELGGELPGVGVDVSQVSPWVSVSLLSVSVSQSIYSHPY